MKARLVTLGETEIRRKVEEEYQKKKDEVYEVVINDVLPQFMAVCLCVLNKDHGFGRKRLLSFLDGVKTQFAWMDGIGILGQKVNTLDCLEYLKKRYDIDVDKEMQE